MGRLIFAFAATLAVALPPSAVAGPLRSTELRVIDGDTFDFAGERIRIADIDTPETRQARCPYEKQLGDRATERLRDLLRRPFALVPAQRDADRYGRKLRHVVQNGRSMGEVLVSEGLARPYGRGRQPWCGIS